MRPYTVIIPAHNEGSYLESSVEKVLGEDPEEVIIVEDGCTDSTPEIASQLSDKHSEVCHIHREDRMGKGAAIVQGVKASNNERVCFMDADLSTDLKGLGELVNSLDTAEFAVGSRYLGESSADRSNLRLLFSKGYNFLARNLLKTGLRDHQCGFKAFKKKPFLQVNDLVRSTGWFWDTEIVYHAKKAGCTVKEVPVKWEKASDSEVKISTTTFELGKGLYRIKMEEFFGSKAGRLNEYFKFAFIGGLGAAINSAVLYILTEYLGVYYVYSSFAAIEAAIIIMFFLNNLYTFSETKSSVGEILEGLLRSNLIRSLGIAVNIGLLWALTSVFGLYYLVSNIIAIFVASVVNFYGERNFNWNNE
ncbi:MAG: glycosyltransferase [Candidatus Nanohalobium sp.]